MAGILYGVGVGPGDPELMTLKAARIIKENKVMALPGKRPVETTAYKIAAGAVPEIKDKELLAVYMPMVHDKKEQKMYHEQGAEMIERYLNDDENVVFLTLGDVTVYSTFKYIQHIVEADGYICELISGVPSFCAAAATLKTSIGSWEDQIHIYPAVHGLNEKLPDRGTVVLMKSGSKMGSVKEMVKKSGRNAMMVENCGMDDERVYSSVDDIPDTAGYYSLIIAKEDNMSDGDR